MAMRFVSDGLSFKSFTNRADTMKPQGILSSMYVSDCAEKILKDMKVRQNNEAMQALLLEAASAFTLRFGFLWLHDFAPPPGLRPTS